MLYSFDVFDTVITRSVASPKDIFRLIQYRLKKENDGLADNIVNNFAVLREGAETLARLNHQKTQNAVNLSHWQEDITLRQIYEAMVVAGEISEVDIQKLMDIEIEAEIQNAIGIQENISRIKSLIAEGNRVILISDMYMEGSVIRRMLEQVDEEIAGLPLYVSVDIQKGKYTGSLYRHIQKIENVPFAEWEHCGDNELADQLWPTWLGMKVRPYMKPNHSDFEKYLIHKKGKSEQEALLAGMSYYVRWQNALDGSAAIGANIGGPILYAYVSWMLERCMTEKIKRLYFIARDGYILKKIADIIIDVKKIDIKTYYIYGSRKAWRLPSFNTEIDSLVLLISWSNTYQIRTIGDLAKALGLSYEEIMPFLPLKYRDVNRRLSPFELYTLTRELDACIVVKKLIQKKQQEDTILSKAYLKQVVDTSDKAYAFVELAGGGYTQTCLAKLLNVEEDIYSFYFKLDRTTVSDGCRNEAFLPYQFRLNLLIEMFCRAPHGQTLGYRREEEEIVPILQDSDFADGKEYEAFVRGVELFAEAFVKQESRSGVKLDSRELIFNCMRYVAETPSPEVYEYFANIPNGQTGRENKPVAFAPRLKKSQLRKIFLLKEWEPIDYYYEGSAFDYSLLQCSNFEKKQIEFYKKLRNTKYGRWIRKKFQEKQATHKEGEEFYLDIWQEKIVIYAAGKVGQRFYEQMKNNTFTKVVLWADKMPEKYVEQGYSVRGIDKIEDLDYDQIVVAVKTWEAYLEIESFLVERGLPCEKIFWVGNTNTNVRWV